MAGFTIIARIDATEAFKLARKAAKRLDFNTQRLDDWEFAATKGSLALSIFLGAFIAYCDFRVFVEEERNEKVAITIERNSPWWTGYIGVRRVHSHAKELADEIEDAILDQGGEVVKRKEF